MNELDAGQSEAILRGLASVSRAPDESSPTQP